MFTPIDQVKWRQVKYLKEPLTASPEHAKYKYELVLPEPLASWDVFDYWEKERIASMEQHLKHGDVLYDIGTEQGWCNLVYASIVGPENIVLVEPTPEFWPNIYYTWYRNFNDQPRGFYAGLFSDKTTDRLFNFKPNKWPESILHDLIDRNKYQYIHANNQNIPEIELDDYVAISTIIPDAITMDVEGAELLVLRGAKFTLETYKPKCWISIHPDLGERDYGILANQTIKFMTDLGYKAEFLAEDHEQHWYFHA